MTVSLVVARLTSQPKDTGAYVLLLWMNVGVVATTGSPSAVRPLTCCAGSCHCSNRSGACPLPLAVCIPLCPIHGHEFEKLFPEVIISQYLLPSTFTPSSYHIRERAGSITIQYDPRTLYDSRTFSVLTMLCTFTSFSTTHLSMTGKN